MRKPHEIVAVAREYVLGWDFVELGSIAWVTRFQQGALFYPPHGENPARIEMGWDQDPDVLWHEIFHSVFHRSPLRRNNDCWGESFCNAFSEVSRQIFFKESIVDGDWEKAARDRHWGQYIVPCVIILSRVQFSRSNFFSFWTDINRAAQEDPEYCLAKHLGYNPATGKQI